MSADATATAYGDTVVHNRERMGIHWATMPHLFLPLYPYTYGAGTAALALGSRILNATDGTATATATYLNLLRTGASRHEHDALVHAGVDLTQSTPWQAAFDTLAGYIDRLEELTE